MKSDVCVTGVKERMRKKATHREFNNQTEFPFSNIQPDAAARFSF